MPIPNYNDRGDRSDATQESIVINTAATHALEPHQRVVAVGIPASGNVVLTPPSAGEYGDAKVLIYVASDAGAGNVQMDTSGVDGGLADGWPSFDNLTAVGDYWLFAVHMGMVVELIQEEST